MNYYPSVLGMRQAGNYFPVHQGIKFEGTQDYKILLPYYQFKRRGQLTDLDFTLGGYGPYYAQIWRPVDPHHAQYADFETCDGTTNFTLAYQMYIPATFQRVMQVRKQA